MCASVARNDPDENVPPTRTVDIGAWAKNCAAVSGASSGPLYVVAAVVVTVIPRTVRVGELTLVAGPWRKDSASDVWRTKTSAFSTVPAATVPRASM